MSTTATFACPAGCAGAAWNAKPTSRKAWPTPLTSQSQLHHHRPVRELLQPARARGCGQESGQLGDCVWGGPEDKGNGTCVVTWEAGNWRKENNMLFFRELKVHPQDWADSCVWVEEDPEPGDDLKGVERGLVAHSTPRRALGRARMLRTPRWRLWAKLKLSYPPWRAGELGVDSLDEK